MSLVDGAAGATGTGQRMDLRQILRRQRKDSDPTSGDAPDLEFQYSDTDTYTHELSELYSYSEASEFYTTREVFEACLEASHRTCEWSELSDEERRSFVMSLLNRFEVVQPQERLEAVKSLLYLAHGNFSPEIREEELEPAARANIFMMLELGVYSATIELLAVEMEQGKGVYEGSRANITIADNYNLRMCLSLLYVMIETIRREKESDPPHWVRLRKSFIESLSETVVGEETLTSLLFMMLLSFCNGTMPHYPIKRILLLIWKTILAMMGGMGELEEIKKQRREAAGLPAEFTEIRPCRPLVLPTPAYDPRGQIDGAAARIGRGVSQVSDTDSVGEVSVSGGKGLDFRPKARKRDVEGFIESCRSKYGCFKVGEGGNDLAGLPEPIQESIRVLRQHIYIPLSDIQIAEEEEAKKRQACAFPGVGPLADEGEDSGVMSTTKRNNPTEKLYGVLLPNLPQYMIALLKVLLAAAPTSRARNDSLNILVDVLPLEAPANIVESTQVTFDVNRHKEIIVKAISATLLLLLKHFKVNHIYQFEYMSQHLVFANCIPLVLKFFNQNMMQYISARNNFPSLNFPTCVLIPQSGEVTMEVSESTTTDPGFCWRNLFSCINLVRILQKLTKWKHFRTVMLVVFRSAPILKRALKVRHPMMQLYILKLLKVQTKYLGRNWRRSNMKTISAIYRRVRHHLHDDWAYGNDLDARPWDFQQQEFALKASIEHFNTTYYAPESPQNSVDPFGGKLSPISQNYMSVLGEHVPLSASWKEKYEEWLEVEVFQMPRDWDRFLESPEHFMDAKPMDL